MATLHRGERAPAFSHPDLDGNLVNLEDFRGHKVMLVFFRYATCPFCTVRFVRLTQEAQRYSEHGIKIIGIFESSTDYIREYLSCRGLPFPIIPDPEGKLYTLYGVNKSLPGLMLGMFRIPTLLRALFDRDYHMAVPDGSLPRIPADFLIGADQTIAEAYYGSDIGDHIPFRHIEQFVSETDITPLPTGGL